MGDTYREWERLGENEVNNRETEWKRGMMVTKTFIFIYLS